MNKFIKIILLALLFSIIKGSSGTLKVKANTGTGGRIELVCPVKGGRIGDPLAFTLRIKLPATALLEPSSLSSMEIRPLKNNGLSLQKNFFSCTFTPFDHIEFASRKSFEIHGVMRFYVPGDFQLAPISLLYRQPESGITTDNQDNDPNEPKVSTLTSNRIKIHIASLQPGGQPAPTLIIPDKEPRFITADLKQSQTRQQLYCLALTLSLMLTLFFAASCYRRRKKELPDKIETPDRLIPDITAALRDAVKLKEVENHWRHLVEIDHLLRRFLLLQENLPDTAIGGRGTAFSEHLTSCLNPQMAARLQQIWSEIDRTVALEIEKYQDFPKLRRDLQLWLKEYSKSTGGRHGF
ncbi:MAG TPA: hypothetical protein EYP64_08550 [Desulfarculaceae bacterium]|nr:hypothetical protein [Desulfarculaceae bacterium]